VDVVVVEVVVVVAVMVVVVLTDIKQRRVLRVIGGLEEPSGRDSGHRLRAKRSEEAQRKQQLVLANEHVHNFLVGRGESLEHVEGKLKRWRVLALERQQQARHGLRVVDDVVLQKLV
jgi:hypothetical protein